MAYITYDSAEPLCNGNAWKAAMTDLKNALAEHLSNEGDDIERANKFPLPNGKTRAQWEDGALAYLDSIFADKSGNGFENYLKTSKQHALASKIHGKWDALFGKYVKQFDAQKSKNEKDVCDKRRADNAARKAQQASDELAASLSCPLHRKDPAKAQKCNLAGGELKLNNWNDEQQSPTVPLALGKEHIMSICGGPVGLGESILAGTVLSDTTGKGRTITPSAFIGVGPCTDSPGHKDANINVYKNGELLDYVIKNNSTKFKVYADLKSQSWQDIFFLQCKPTEYKIELTSCGEDINTKLLVYPKIEWNAQFSYDCNAVTEANTGIELNCLYDDKNLISLGSSLATKVVQAARTLEAIEHIANTLSGDAPQTKNKHGFSLKKPILQITGAWKYDEGNDGGNYSVDKIGSIKLAANPLVGATYDLSLLKLAATALGIPWVKNAYDWAKTLLPGGVKIDIDGYVRFKGEIKLSMESKFGQDSSTNETKAVSEIGVKLMLTLEAGAKKLVFSMGKPKNIGASAALEASIGTSIYATYKFAMPSNGSSSLTVACTCTGLVLEISLELSLGIGITEFSYEREYSAQIIEPAAIGSPFVYTF